MSADGVAFASTDGQGDEGSFYLQVIHEGQAFDVIREAHESLGHPQEPKTIGKEIVKKVHAHHHSRTFSPPSQLTTEQSPSPWLLPSSQVSNVSNDVIELYVKYCPICIQSKQKAPRQQQQVCARERATLASRSELNISEAVALIPLCRS